MLVYGLIQLITGDALNIVFNSWILKPLAMLAIILNIPTIFPIVKVFTDAYVSGDTSSIWFDTVLIVALQFIPNAIVNAITYFNYEILAMGSPLLDNGFIMIIQAIPIIYNLWALFDQFYDLSGILYGIPFAIVAYFNFSPVFLLAESYYID